MKRQLVHDISLYDGECILAVHIRKNNILCQPESGSLTADILRVRDFHIIAISEIEFASRNPSDEYLKSEFCRCHQFIIMLHHIEEHLAEEIRDCRLEQFIVYLVEILCAVEFEIQLFFQRFFCLLFFLLAHLF